MNEETAKDQTLKTSKAGARIPLDYGSNKNLKVMVTN